MRQLKFIFTERLLPLGLIAFGLAFVGGGISITLSKYRLLRASMESGVGVNYYQFELLGWIPFLLVLLCFGLVFINEGKRQIQLRLKLSQARTSIAETMVRRGEEFHFSYQQHCRKEVAVKSIGVFLVFRELGSYDTGSDSGGRIFMDRLVQQFTHEGRVYEAGEMINVNYLLRIPTRKMGTRNPLMHLKNAKIHTTWVVKVHLDQGQRNLWEEDRDFWTEHEVEVNNEAIENGSNPIEQSPVQSFDVFLSSSHWRNSSTRVTETLAEFLAHLNTYQATELFRSNPCLIMENVSKNQAQNAKERLEAAGAKVEIKPAI